MENMNETNVNKNDDTIYSFVDYKLQNDEKNLKLMDSKNFIYNTELGYTFGFVGQQNNLIEHQQAEDCGIASVLNVLLQSGLTEKEIYERMVNFDDYSKEKLPYNNQTISDIELALLEYTIASSKFYNTDYGKDETLTTSSDGRILDGETDAYERQILLNQFGIETEKTIDITFQELVDKIKEGKGAIVSSVHYNARNIIQNSIH